MAIGWHAVSVYNFRRMQLHNNVIYVGIIYNPACYIMQFNAKISEFFSNGARTSSHTHHAHSHTYHSIKYKLAQYYNHQQPCNVQRDASLAE